MMSGPEANTKLLEEIAMCCKQATELQEANAKLLEEIDMLRKQAQTEQALRLAADILRQGPTTELANAGKQLAKAFPQAAEIAAKMEQLLHEIKTKDEQIRDMDMLLQQHKNKEAGQQVSHDMLAESQKMNKAKDAEIALLRDKLYNTRHVLEETLALQ